MNTWYEHHVYGYTVVIGDTFHPCFWCQGPTNTLHCDFVAPLHQGLCTLQAVKAYWEAVIAHNHKETP